MPLRGGESVGRAYVRIYADGAEVPDDIRRMLEDAEPSVREAGKDLGRTYGDEFDKESRKTFKTHFGDSKKGMFEDLNDGLTKSLARIELSKRFFDGPEWKKFLHRLEDEFGDAGTLAGKRWEAEFRDSTDLSSLVKRIGDIGPAVRRAQAEMLNSLHEDALRMNRAFDRALLDEDRRRSTELRKQEQDVLRSSVLFKSLMRDITEQIDRLERGDKSMGRNRLHDMLNDLEKIAPSLGFTDRELRNFTIHMEEQNRRLRESHPLLSRFDHSIIIIGDRMGRLFGKGSRNNFLNFFGSVIEFLVKIPRILPATLGWITGLGRSMHYAFDEVLREGGSGVRAILAAVAAGFEGVGGAALTGGLAIIAFVGFIGVLGLVLGPVIGLLSGLVGILTALAGSVLYGLIGSVAAFGPLLPVLGGVAAGIIAIVQAIKGVSDASPAFKRAVSSVRDEASSLWKVFKDKALERLPEVLHQAGRELGQLDPLARAAGKGFNRFLGDVVDAVDSPAMHEFFNRFTRFLPSAMNSLGSIIGNILRGISGVLVASVPLSRQLLHWLDGVTEDFAKWANTKQGRHEVRQFLRDAADSASALGDFLLQATKWLAKLLKKGEGTGDDIFHNMADDFQRWTTWMDDHPHAVQDWFGNAEDLSHDIGDLVDSLNDLVATLDDASNRAAGNDIIQILSFTLRGLSTAVKTTDRAILGAWDRVRDFGSWLGWFFSTLGKAVWYIVGGQWAGDLVHGIWAGLKAGGEWIKEKIGGWLSDLFGGGLAGGGAMAIKPTLDLSSVTHGLTRLGGMIEPTLTSIRQRFGKLPGQVASAIRNLPARVLAVFAPIPVLVAGLVGQVVSRWGNVPSRINRTIGSIWNAISSRFTDIPGQLDSVITDILGKFQGLGARILAAIGNIVIHPIVDMSGIPGTGTKHGSYGGTAHSAAGRLVTYPMLSTLGEEGPEAVVPLNRPLSQVDPSVRMLSAFAQGLATPGGSGPGRVIHADGWQIVTPSSDPRAVAAEVFNELVGAAL